MRRRIRFWLAWYVPLFGLWLLFVDRLAAEELILGAVAAAVAATAADVARAQDLVRFRMRARWLTGLSGLPGQVLRDSWVLAVALWRQLRRPGSVGGLFRVLPFPIEGDDAVAAARGAAVAGSGGASRHDSAASTLAASRAAPATRATSTPWRPPFS